MTINVVLCLSFKNAEVFIRDVELYVYVPNVRPQQRRTDRANFVQLDNVLYPFKKSLRMIS